MAGSKHGSQEISLKRILCMGFALFLLAPALLAAQQPEDSTPARAAAGPLAAVHGVVLNSANGQPLARALVRIEGDAANGALSDGEGRFELDGVPAGPQIFQILKPGFRDPDAMAEAGEMQGAEHNVLVAAEMPGLTFRLTPLSSIRGQVELSTGDPAEGIVVRLLRQSIAHGRAVWGEDRFVRTDSQGNYRFGGLPGGVYALYNDPLLESAPATTLVEPGSGGSVAQNGYPAVFYPDARELAGAARIRLTAGDQAQANLTLTLEPCRQSEAASRWAPAPRGKMPARSPRPNCWTPRTTTCPTTPTMTTPRARCRPRCRTEPTPWRSWSGAILWAASRLKPTRRRALRIPITWWVQPSSLSPARQ
jgi:hypothetical protein